MGIIKPGDIYFLMGMIGTICGFLVRDAYMHIQSDTPAGLVVVFVLILVLAYIMAKSIIYAIRKVKLKVRIGESIGGHSTSLKNRNDSSIGDSPMPPKRGWYP